MSNNKVIPLGKKTIGAIEYYGFRSGIWFTIVKKDVTTLASITYGYKTYATSALYTAAFAAPGAVVYDSVPTDYITELSLSSLFEGTAVTVIGAVTTALTSTERTPSRTVVSAAGAGTVAAGARMVAIELSSDFTGTLDGDTTSAGGMLTPGGVYTWSVNQNDDTVGAISYNITTGKIAIQKTV